MAKLKLVRLYNKGEIIRHDLTVLVVQLDKGSPMRDEATAGLKAIGRMINLMRQQLLEVKEV